MQRGFTLIELLIVVVIIGILAAIAIPQLQAAMLRSHVASAAAEAKTLYTGFKQHFVDRNMYPYATSAPNFQLDTFEPLVSMGYYRGGLPSRLSGGQADDYDSPDDQGTNQEFWLEMTLKYDPTVRILVVDSDDAPLTGGAYFDGVYVYKDGVLTPAHEVR